MLRDHMLPRARDAALAEDVQEVTRWSSSPMLMLTSPLPHIVNAVPLDSGMNGEKETFGKVMWIDGPVLPRRGYVNMIKADYSVHLQIKGAEPISTPTFNTGDDQGRTTGRAKMGAFYSPILRSELFPTAGAAAKLDSPLVEEAGTAQTGSHAGVTLCLTVQTTLISVLLPLKICSRRILATGDEEHSTNSLVSKVKRITFTVRGSECSEAFLEPGNYLCAPGIRYLLETARRLPISDSYRLIFIHLLLEGFSAAHHGLPCPSPVLAAPLWGFHLRVSVTRSYFQIHWGRDTPSPLLANVSVCRSGPLWKSKSQSYSSLSQFSDSQSLVSRKRISDDSSLCSAVTDGEEMMLEDKGKPGEKQTN
ncbi:unnamed protein product [Leuciscus chuanchicus]